MPRAFLFPFACQPPSHAGFVEFIALEKGIDQPHIQHSQLSLSFKTQGLLTRPQSAPPTYSVSFSPSPKGTSLSTGFTVLPGRNRILYYIDYVYNLK
jgi:hypothetical protein